MKDMIRIRGARENNLKNVSLDIPKHQFVVVTGPSGSGKSTLALDLLQRECQRQYMESNGESGESLEKPAVDSIDGLSPSIAVNQHRTNRNPRSTVGTVTDMYTYLRLIFQKKGERRCLDCQTLIPPPVDEQEAIHCPACARVHEPLTKAAFSFNTPSGACPSCSGLGTVTDINKEAVFQMDKSLEEGAVTFWYDSVRQYYTAILEAAGRYYELDIRGNKALNAYSEAELDLLFHGVESDAFTRHFPHTKPPKTVSKGKFEGVLTGMWRRYQEKNGQSGEAAYFILQECPSCKGERLKKETREVTVCSRTLPSICKSSIHDLHEWIGDVQRFYKQAGDSLLHTVLHDLSVKVERIIRIGLGYLSLDRNSVTLSGGEAQRLRLASILGSGLTGVLYLLDEPTAGLHPKDTDGLVDIMKQLRDLGHTVLVIEHDTRVIAEADHVIDVGPAAGRFGGEIVGQGTLAELMNQQASITGAYLKRERRLQGAKRPGNGKTITIHKANKHNLKDVTASFPLQTLTAVTGVSGSGKSSLVFDVLAEATPSHFEGCPQINGLEHVDAIIRVDQTPLSRMQRSNVATYMDLFAYLRKMFAALPAAKTRGLSAKSFSFNTPGGRCDRCEGLGQVAVDMHFLSHLQVECPVCHGKRFKKDVLAVTFSGYTIADMLNLRIEESLALFDSQKKLTSLLQLLCEVGLGYLQWGQPVTTLSGGEAQRLKLAKELAKQTTGHTLYLLDEPTTGLHPSDIENLFVLLGKLVDAGNTVVVVEHTTELIAASDWVIDMGPGGGDAGGKVVAMGKPQDIAREKSSFTGAFLAPYL